MNTEDEFELRVDSGRTLLEVSEMRTAESTKRAGAILRQARLRFLASVSVVPEAWLDYEGDIRQVVIMNAERVQEIAETLAKAVVGEDIGPVRRLYRWLYTAFYATLVSEDLPLRDSAIFLQPEHDRFAELFRRIEDKLPKDVFDDLEALQSQRRQERTESIEAALNRLRAFWTG